MLYFPDPSKAFYLQTDASDYAFGSVLYQRGEDGETEIIACESRTLKGAEIACYTTEKELALVCSLQKYRSFLLNLNAVLGRRIS